MIQFCSISITSSSSFFSPLKQFFLFFFYRSYPTNAQPNRMQGLHTQTEILKSSNPPPQNPPKTPKNEKKRKKKKYTNTQRNDSGGGTWIFCFHPFFFSIKVDRGAHTPFWCPPPACSPKALPKIWKGGGGGTDYEREREDFVGMDRKGQGQMRTMITGSGRPDK